MAITKWRTPSYFAISGLCNVYSSANIAKPVLIRFVFKVAEKRQFALSYHDKNGLFLQSQFDNPQLGQVLKRLPEEYPGPFCLQKPLILEGQCATLWPLTRPVLSSHRQIKNRHVTGEIFATPEQACAIDLKSGAAIDFENVQIRGR